MPLIDVVFVPQGAETRSVLSGARSGDIGRIVPIGIGPERAAASVAAFLANAPSVRRALVTGVCGASAAELRPGDVLLYENVRDGANVDGEVVAADSELTARLSERLPHARGEVRALHRVAVATTAHEKRALGQRFGTAAIDMESLPALQLLRYAGISTAVLRVVSDGIDDDLPDLNAALGPDGVLHPLRLLRESLRAPWAAIAMARNGMRALANLRNAITRIASTD